MSVKDPFEILADEITLIRRQIDQMSVLFFISADSADPMPGKN